MAAQGFDPKVGRPEYGDLENFDITAQLWDAYITHWSNNRTIITNTDVANMMILLKMGRIITGEFKKDNYDDIIGYAHCALRMNGVG